MVVLMDWSELIIPELFLLVMAKPRLMTAALKLIHLSTFSILRISSFNDAVASETFLNDSAAPSKAILSDK